MTTEGRGSPKHNLGCDLAHELFLPSQALTLEDAEPERLYAALEGKGYVWTGDAWKPGAETRQQN